MKKQAELIENSPLWPLAIPSVTLTKAPPLAGTEASVQTKRSWLAGHWAGSERARRPPETPSNAAYRRAPTGQGRPSDVPPATLLAGCWISTIEIPSPRALLSTQKGSDMLMEVQSTWLSGNYPGITPVNGRGSHRFGSLACLTYRCRQRLQPLSSDLDFPRQSSGV